MPALPCAQTSNNMNICREYLDRYQVAGMPGIAPMPLVSNVTLQTVLLKVLYGIVESLSS